MTFTYGAGYNTDRNKVRLLIGDVNSTGPIYQDEEVDDFLELEANVYTASALALEVLAAKNAGSISKTVGKLSISGSEKSKNYLEAAKAYRAIGKTKGQPQLYAGGISISDKSSIESESDRVTPAFAKKMHDYPITTSTT